MSFEMRSSNQYPRRAGDVRFSSEVITSSRPQETSTLLKQKIQSPQANRSPKSRSNPNSGSPFGQSNLDRHQESRLRATDGLVFPSKSPKSSQKSSTARKANKNDELVKHMSNLPSYLQRVEKGENPQEKVLNFGVLDWERLEKWKYKKCTLPKGSTNAFSSGSSSSFKVDGSRTRSSIQSKSLDSHEKQPPSHCPNLDPSGAEGFSHGINQSRGKVVHQDVDTSSENTLDGKGNPQSKNKYSGRNRCDVKFGRGKREDSDQKITPEKVSSLSALRKHEFSHPSEDGTSARNSVVTNRVEELQASESKFGPKHFHDERGSIVLILPKHPPKESCSEKFQTSGPGMSVGGKPREANRGSFSDSFSSEIHSAELYSEIPHSCPMPTRIENNTESGMRPHGLTQAQSMGLSNDASHTFSHSNETPLILSPVKLINEKGSSMQPSIDVFKRLDHETTEPAAVTGRHSSPTRRFSFTLGKIARSFSFKERSAAPQLTSTCTTALSGSLRSKASDRLSSEEIHSAAFYSEILPTCPLPAGVETNRESALRWHRLASSQSMELPYDESCKLPCPNGTPSTPPRANAIGLSNQWDQESTEAVEGRHPSPHHRFGFGLGRIGRSFSFKEGSTFPQLSSTYATVKSGPIRSEVSDSSDNPDRNKTNMHSRSRSRSSPLRRLLDPLLKVKVANTHHSAATILPSTGNLKLIPKVISSSEYLPEKKNHTTIHAFLYVAMKNGFPVFKLTAKNNGEILVAMRNVTGSGKEDAAWMYSFYCVCEIKKKSGSWIHQGHKGKHYGISYDVVGQMNVFDSHCPDFSVPSSKDQFTVRESVLSSVDRREADIETPEVMANRELAAIIVKIPTDNSGDDRKSHIREAEKVCSTTTVILPGGVHGLPKKGVPSPLTERWKSGGSCDCGGWDVGCKLRILTNEDQSSNPDHFDLFNQGEANDNKPIFSLTPLEQGILSVEFSASISLLQAFSICVAVISSRKTFDFSETNNLSEEKFLQESGLTGRDGIKTPTEVRGEVPANFVPPPPPSPVGRV